MSKQTYTIIERIIIAGMALGIIAMFQPFVIDIYSWGFHLLLVSTLSFIVFTKFEPKETDAKDVTA